MKRFIDLVRPEFVSRIFLLICMAVLLQQAVGAQDAPRVEHRVSKTFVVSGVPTVRLETFDGPITVSSWEKSEVMFTFVKGAKDEQEMKGISLRVQEGGGELSALASFDKAFSREVIFNGQRVLSNSASVEVYIHVPRQVNVFAMSGDGGIRVEGIEGTLDLHAKDGAIVLRKVSGRIFAQTGDGPIEIESSAGELNVQTADGPITLDGHFTQLIASTKDGEITFVIPFDTNAIVETTAKTVHNHGAATAESVHDARGVVRHWRVGSGGNTFKLQTEKGSIYLRRKSTLKRTGEGI